MTESAARIGQRFARVLRARAVLTLCFGAMIGWSWVLMTGVWVGTAGSVGTLVAFAVGGLAIGFIAFTYAELASAMPQVGGEHVYTHVALGPNWSFVCTWALLMAYVTVCVFESVALPTAVEYLVPAIRIGTLWTVVDAPVDLGFVLVGCRRRGRDDHRQLPRHQNRVRGADDRHGDDIGGWSAADCRRVRTKAAWRPRNHSSPRRRSAS